MGIRAIKVFYLILEKTNIKKIYNQEPLKLKYCKKS